MIKNDSIFSDPNLNAEIEKNARKRAFKKGETLIKPGDEIIYIPIVTISTYVSIYISIYGNISFQ